MRQKKNRANIYILLLAVIIAAIAGYYLPSRTPDSEMTMKEYIELAQKKKEQRIRFEEEQRQRAVEEAEKQRGQ